MRPNLVDTKSEDSRVSDRSSDDSNRPVAWIRITPVTLHGGVRKSRAGGPPLWRIVLTCDIRRHLGHLPGRVSAIEGVCRSVFGTVQHTVRHKRAEPSFVKKLAINTASVHFAIDKIRVVLQAWALIIRILYVTLLMTSRAMGLYSDALAAVDEGVWSGRRLH